jgi:methyl coenzyme M reductase beta subunit
VAWSLICGRYSNLKLIAMQHVRHLVQMPSVKKGDAQSLRNVVNHVSKHTNAIQAPSLNTNLNDLIVKHLSVLDSETP